MVDMDKILQAYDRETCVHEYIAEYIVGNNRNDYAACNPCADRCTAYNNIRSFKQKDIIRLTGSAEIRMANAKARGLEDRLGEV